MCILKVTLLVLAMFGIARGAIFSDIQAERQDAPEKCKHKGKDYAVNTTVTLDGCKELSCDLLDGYHRAEPHSRILVLLIASCTEPAVPGGCAVVTNDTAPYPHCCPTLQC